MAVVSDTYLSIGSPSEGLYKELGSRFIALAYPVETEDEVKALVDAARKKYHDARHHCFAYRLGLGGEKFRANDDGEPSSSAGRPILGQIDSAGLSDVLVIVVRYFGGIKLGVPGLIRAYKTATADALSSAAKVTKVAGSFYTVKFSYDEMPAVMKIVKEMGLEASERDFNQTCSLRLRVRLSSKEDFLEKMRKCCLEIIGE